ncbi:MAG: twin-arginine translocase TatA/TatE family subunit [Acidimicrobiales bacterium]
MFIGEILGPDLLIVAIIAAVLIFGGSAIPKFARSLGQAKSEFEKGISSAKTTSETIKSAVVITDPSPLDIER